MNAPVPDLHKCVYVRANHWWSSFIYRRREYKGFYGSLQIAVPNNVLVSQIRGWSLVYSIDIYTLIPHYGLFLWAMIRKPSAIFGTVCESWIALTVSITRSYTLLYLGIFIDYYGECEMADMSTYLEWSNRESTHISTVCSSLHGRDGRSQQSSLAFKATWTKKRRAENRAAFDRVKVFFTLPLRYINQNMLYTFH